MSNAIEIERLPDVFICGFTKCGTSSLHDWLTQHPDISGGFQKELEFLYDEGSYFYKSQRNIHAQGIAGYASLFKKAPQHSLWIDSTPAYVYHDTARKVIARMAHRPPVVLVTRAPIDQITSTYHYFSNNKLYISPSVGIEDFLEMVIDDSVRHKFKQDHLKHALDWACFEYWLKLWRRDLGEDRVFNFDMRNMINDPLAVTNSIISQLGLAPLHTIDRGGSNETYFVKSKNLQKVNTMVRGFIPQGRIYENMRSFYRRFNTSFAKPERSTRELELRLELECLIDTRQEELIDML